MLIAGVLGAACAIFLNGACRRGSLSSHPVVRDWSAALCFAWPLIVLALAIATLGVVVAGDL
jgi:hypothetical protein